MKTISSAGKNGATGYRAIQRWICIVTLAAAGATLVPNAHAQANVKPSVVVPNELSLPPIDANGNPFFRLPPPAHLSGSDRGRYHAHFVLVATTNAYPFVVDASSSTGSNSVPLTFQWGYFVDNATGGDFFPLAGPTTSPYFTNDPPNLDNSTSREMVLDVSNGTASERLWFGVVVLTPQAATDAMIAWIDAGYPLPTSRAQRRLLPPLREASAHFAAGETDAAATALSLFLRRLKLSRLPLTRHEARVFKALTPAIIGTATQSTQ